MRLGDDLFCCRKCQYDDVSNAYMPKTLRSAEFATGTHCKLISTLLASSVCNDALAVPELVLFVVADCVGYVGHPAV